MTILNHTLGFPRIGLRRELKKALESYWAGDSTQQALLATGRELRARHWQQQKEAGVDLLPVGDFAWYDHVLTTSLMLGNVPVRHQNKAGTVNLDTLFRLGRGRAPTGEPAAAAEMTKWFNTNYHYIVPEFIQGQTFKLTWTQLLDEVDEALALGHNIKPVLLGPVTYLWLGKVKGEPFERLSLLGGILPVYQQVLAELAKRGIEWVQIDEPALALELPQTWREAFKPAYDALQGHSKLLLTTYFDSIGQNIDVIRALPVQGLHVDLVHGRDDIQQLNQQLPASWLLSLGVINGRNVWRADLSRWFSRLQPLTRAREQVWIGSSCSLLHSPIDLSVETRLDDEVKSWFAFALQKCAELSLLSQALNKTMRRRWKPGAHRYTLALTPAACIMRRWASVCRPLPHSTANARALIRCGRSCSVSVSICQPGLPPPSALFRRPLKFAACASTLNRAGSTATIIAPVSRSTLSRRFSNRSGWSWMCWSTVKRNVTTWLSTSANIWRGLSSHRMAGFRATVHAV